MKIWPTLFFSFLLVPLQAFAWGKYGHQQVNDAAVKFLIQSGSPEAECFQKHEDLMKRLAITPDFDWKAINMANTPPALKHQKALDDKQEHPNHFSERFCPKEVPAAQCPPKRECDKYPYDQAMPCLKTLMIKQRAYINQQDPTKAFTGPVPTDAEVLEHGTAPWRIVQLYDLAKEALKAGDTETALIMMGAMGHYVGDMCQPFHASMNFDGQASVPPARGIHHTYEECILEDAAKGHSVWDNNTWIYDKFDETETNVLEAAKRTAGPKATAVRGLKRDNIIAAIFALVYSGEQLIDPLAEAFSSGLEKYRKDHPPRNAKNTDKKAADRKISQVNEGDSSDTAADTTIVVPTDKDPTRKGVHDKPPTIPAKFCGVYRDMKITDPTTKQVKTVIQTAEERMGLCAGLLAKIWVQIYRDAGVMAGDKCPASIPIDEAFMGKVINGYPKFSDSYKTPLKTDPAP